jgi:hypothetical protein
MCVHPSQRHEPSWTTPRRTPRPTKAQLAPWRQLRVYAAALYPEDRQINPRSPDGTRHQMVAIEDALVLQHRQTVVYTHRSGTRLTAARSLGLTRMSGAPQASGAPSDQSAYSRSARGGRLSGTGFARTATHAEQDIIAVSLPDIRLGGCATSRRSGLSCRSRWSSAVGRGFGMRWNAAARCRISSPANEVYGVSGRWPSPPRHVRPRTADRPLSPEPAPLPRRRSTLTPVHCGSKRRVSSR